LMILMINVILSFYTLIYGYAKISIIKKRPSRS
jgi:hypothetical protein